MQSPHGDIVHKEGRVFIPAKNAGHRRIRPGDWVLFKPHVRRSLFLVVKDSRPNSRARRNHCGLACDEFKKGEVGRVQVYGPADPKAVAASYDFVQVKSLSAAEMDKPVVIG